MLIGPQNLVLPLTQVRSRIINAAKSVGRDPQAVTLVAVSKTKPASLIRAAAALGVQDFGENYLQEALDKIAALADLELTWHFIGAVQSNKTRQLAENFAWVHGVDKLKIAQRLSAQRPFHAPPLNVCIQVELIAEHNKGGVAAPELQTLADQMAELPRMRLRGLMCIPPPGENASEQLQRFRQLAELLQALNVRGHRLDTLSMGMSDDFEIAIQAGATLVRIGTAIFGAR